MRLHGRMAPLRIEYLIDPDTSAPVQATSWAILLREPDTIFIRTTFETYDRTALTPETEQVLRIKTAGKRIRRVR